MYQIAILKAAEQDIQSAIKWYEQQNISLGEKFRESLFLQIDSLKKNFIEYGPVFRGFSRILLKRYPYVVYFKKDHEERTIKIFAVLNKKQDRSNLQNRA